MKFDIFIIIFAILFAIGLGGAIMGIISEPNLIEIKGGYLL